MRLALRYIFLIVLAFIMMPRFAQAQTTVSQYYFIISADDFVALTENPLLWTKTCIQLADIDLGGRTITPIGLNNKSVFSGSYFGKGFTISNATILWDEQTADSFCYGLFGFVNGTSQSKCAEICNLNISKIKITRMSGKALTHNGKDSRIGILAGHIGENTKIHDISIQNCIIDEGDVDPKARALYVGGVVGDFAKSFGGTGDNLINNEKYFVFKNIFSNVDFIFEKSTTTEKTNCSQSYIGGIVGRIRTPTSYTFIPRNTLYTGTINAPRSSESPTVSNTRYSIAYEDNGLNGNAVKLYAGNISGDEILAESLSDEDYENFINTRLYYDYHAYNASSKGIEKITDTNPSPDEAYAYKTRTFLPNNGNPSFDANTEQEKWAYVQGVNFGKGIDPTKTKDKDDALNMFNDELTELITGTSDKVYGWYWDDGKFKVKSNYNVYNDLSLTKVNSEDKTKYEVALKYKGNTVNTAIYQWERTSNIQDEGSWQTISGATESSITFSGEYYYRAKCTIGTFTLTSDYFAPVRTIYVYDKSLTDNYRKYFPTAYFGDNFESYPDGDDNNDGATPNRAVKTLKEAFGRLDVDGDVNTNRIVVMGYIEDRDFYGAKNDNHSVVFQKPVTISGTDKESVVNGVFAVLPKLGKDETKTYSEVFLKLNAPLTFDNINLQSKGQEADYYQIPSDEFKGKHKFYIICNYYDFTINENVNFVNFADIGAAEKIGLPANITSLPHITIVAGYQDDNTGKLQYPSEIHGDKKGFYTEKGRGNLNLNSGCVARVIGGSRNDGNNKTSNNISGQYDKVHCVKININISNDINLFDSDTSNDYSKYGYTLSYNSDDDTYTKILGNYTHNIGLLAGGQTDGAIYGDIEVNIYSGYVARVISGNISYGRLFTGYPSDSFFGRSIINIFGRSSVEAGPSAKTYQLQSETVINEIFGGVLGRCDGGSKCEPFFYGESQINMFGGLIGSHRTTSTADLRKITPDIYGAGSGGISGLGTASYHTCDTHIPYLKEGSLNYGDYQTAVGEGCTIPTLRMYNGDLIDLTKTKSSINLYSGIVEGNVYGAGYGFSNNIPEADASKFPQDDNGNCQAGMLFGESSVNMIKISEYTPVVVLGNIFGGAAGSSKYAEYYKKTIPNPYLRVASQYGNAYVQLDAGTVGNKYTSTGGNVFAGAMGIKGYDDIAALYGNANIEVNGATIYGHIYGGSDLANIRKGTDPETGNTVVEVNSGTIGNCIFGGSNGDEDSKAIIEGDTHVTINGGDFLDYPYIELGITDEDASNTKKWNTVDHPDAYRSFNIYGGGNVNCDILGTAYVKVYSSLLKSENSFVPMEQNPNALTEHNVSRFQGAYMDITYRRFCVYGGGYGLKTNVMNTDVYVTIPPERPGVTKPHGFTLDKFLDHQSFFDISGGGYSGDVGYWADKDGISVKDIDITGKTAGEVADLYHHYVGGKCKVTIDGYTYARKIIGGGFYGSCRSTNTHVLCGSLRQVYGGSLLGYVHDKALLQFGNRTEDFLRKTGNDASGKNIYEFDAIGYYGPHGGDFPEYEGDKANVSDEVWRQAEARAKELNDFIFITEDIYGGNDVKGIIGTKKWQDELTGDYGTDATDGGPLFQTDITSTEEKGIVFNIYGGTFMGNVYSAGNGHYRGYFVPEWVRYHDGPARMYREVISSVDSNKKAKVYRSRPMVGCVNVNIRGNSKDDFVKLRRNFYGGGRECTIGQFNTMLPLEDPRRMIQGGHLHVNFGGFTQIDGNVYMGAEGETIGKQYEVPEGIDLKKFNGSTSKELARLGTVAYDHWYYDEETQCYLPGFPAPGKVDGNFGMTGHHMLHSYMQNVQMQGDVETTFYRNLYERDENGGFKYFKDENDKEIIDATGNHFRVRKHWSPGELATKREFADENDPDRIYAYNAEGITFNSFYLGGLSGTMTNNNLMVYCYANHIEADPEKDDDPAHDHEQWGSIYRVTLPQGVTVRDKVVMGSENANVHYQPYKYDASQTTIDTESPDGYTYQGGLITQRTYSFDLIVYNDSILQGADVRHFLPTDFYTPTGVNNVDSTHIKYIDEYTIQYGVDKGTKIYRKVYADNVIDTSKARRYGLATIDAEYKTAYVGPHEKRRENTGEHAGDNAKTVSKLTVACRFDPLQTSDSKGHDDHAKHYGGNVYGGCYRSGVVIGNVVINIGSNLLGDHVDVNSASTFGDISSLKYNIGRVFGGGFGEDTRIEGDTYINLLNNFRGMNVFGGGMKGDVTGTAHINYIGSEVNSFVFGAIYGGGLKGSVGSPQYLDEEKTILNPDATKQSTIIRLFSGNVDRVYGGSCMGNLYGRTFVELCDEVVSGLDHLDASRMNFDWASSRLVAGSVYGGNDITGVITPYEYTDPYTGTDKEETLFRDFSAGVYVHEVADAEAKTTPGANDRGYNGFPLIGDLYGGGNGDYGTQKGEYYSTGTVIFANGDSIDTEIVELAKEGSEHKTPNNDKTHICIEGGTVINAFGGGDMSTITDQVKVSVNYPVDSNGARAGFETDDELTRVWNVLNFSSDEFKDEVTSNIADSDGKKHPVFQFPIFRLFGGNNNADMAIQPTWNLVRGNIGSLYSGGNIGRMTYYNASPGVGQNKGLTLTIDSPDIEIDNVYGGARIGDITPLVLNPTTFEYEKPSSPGDDFYGATLNIKSGIIQHVYGGNDVTGFVNFGTNVNINGAISGDVYCAGNGNYLYKYDRNANLFDYSDESHLHVKELYEFEKAKYKGARYFVLPAKADYGFVKTALDDKGHGASYGATDAQTVMAINSYRPNVERSKLVIEGNDGKTVWVRGSVYCGGNSSTVVSGTSNGSVEFVIGNNVVLNGVFLGSNGESLANGKQIEYTEKLNGVTSDAGGITINTPLKIDAANDLEDTQIPTNEASALDKTTYKTILDLYMRAVEIADKPKNFNFPTTLTEAYIGEFVVGGNHGSITTKNKIELTFPESLVIYDKIIGGCKNTNVEYKDAKHIGGLTMPLDLSNTENDAKIHLVVKSKFLPMSLNYPDPSATPPISKGLVMLKADGLEEILYAIDDEDFPADGKYYRNGQCNVFGGCYTSGRTVGDIKLDIYSDMLQYDGMTYEKGGSSVTKQVINKQAVINGMEDKSWRSFTVVGGGYGTYTEVYGNVQVRFLPEAEKPHPSAATVFGGSQEGLIVGNTRVELRDGKILANLYGASEASRMYGSTEVIIGYPKYYTPKVAGIYTLNRTDYMSETATGNKRYDGETGPFVIPKTIAYRMGDIVPENIYDMIIGKVNDEGIEVGQFVEDDKTTIITHDQNDTDTSKKKITEYFEEVSTITPDTYGVTWNDIVIWVGDQGSNIDPKNPYYKQGNVYGGGFIPHNSAVSLAGENTVMRFTEEYNPGDNSLVNYGGNSAVIIWDNPENATMESGYKDHVHIGTGRFTKVEGIIDGSSVRGLFKKVGLTGGGTAYLYQSFGKAKSGEEYYMKEADGGVYGSGRKVFVEGFSSIDLAYYGYAEHTPQNPKLLNTIQRADVATVKDCCMELYGASDFTRQKQDNTMFAINRVGELRMTSSITASTTDLVSSTIDTANGIIVNNTPRSRNYIALYHKAHRLCSFRSNWSLEQIYHNEEGELSKLEQNVEDGYPFKKGDKYYESYVNHKHDRIELYNKLLEFKRLSESEITDKERKELIGSYNAFMNVRKTDWNYDDSKSLEEQCSEVESEIIRLFNQRNVGTSANMIGINSGYELRIEGSLSKEEDIEDQRYFGPAYGVTEIKLLTEAKGIGGGYVYALNHHRDYKIDGGQNGVETEGWCSKFNGGKQDFLMTTGNFVFPGAAYGATTDADKHNYIVDDCYDKDNPQKNGYYTCYEEYLKSTPSSPSQKPSISRDCEGSETGTGTSSSFNINNILDAHYWYVTGDTYIHNVTVTGVTSADTEHFHINSDEAIVSLFNVKAGSEIIVKDVSWGQLTNEVNELLDLDKGYKIFLTVDHNVNNESTSATNGAFVAPIPRVDYSYVKEGDSDPVETWKDDEDKGTKPNQNPTAFGKYTEDETKKENVPLLGIHLEDSQKNDEKEIFNKGLSQPYEAQIWLETKDKDSNVIITYVINLSINYLFGPKVTGNIEIENCALPGEYIYVNAENVNIEMDESMAVTQQSFKIYPCNDKGTRIEGKEYKVTKSDCADYIVEGNDRLIHIPAYWYMNGWEVAYCVTAGKKDFEITLPGFETKEIPDPNDISKTITVPDESKPILENRLWIHNYHKMKPGYTVNGEPIDLKWVPGVRIYIEDDEDMEYYFKYLEKVQTDTDEKTKDGQTIHPQYAKGLDFYLQANVNIPTAEALNYDENHKLILKNNFHGNGKRMHIPWNAKITMDNHGNMYNVGFVMEKKPDNLNISGYYPTIYNTNSGTIENCYYYNYGGVGSLVGSTGGTLRNCYQNTPVPSGFEYNQLLQISDAGFRYGQVAYNLNGYYLQKRHILLHGKTGETTWCTDNNSFALEAKDDELRTKSIAEYDKYAVSYIEKMFNDGEYRYAFYNPSQDYPQFTEALRTNLEPNYLDYLGNYGTAKSVSMHDHSHKVDTKRWCEDHQTYRPQYDIDYLFFGQDLTVDIDKVHLPDLFSPSTRVYRVGGFYGTSSDKGYFFNKQAYVDAHNMTAVDFVGYRDREMYDAGMLKSDYRSDIEDNGWVIKPDHHEVYCPPTLDLPWVMEGTQPMHDFDGLTISDKVTHNLLIYTRDNDKASTYVQNMHYDGDFINTSLQHHSEENIRAHHIVDADAGPKMYGDYLHIVDGHDFHVPVAFKVKQGWLRRQPADFADEYTMGTTSYKTAWEGICLPYTVKRVYAAASDPLNYLDYGEITHFYGDSQAGHEYWLRRFKGINADGELTFERPTDANKGNATDDTGTYTYTNTFFYDTFKDKEYVAEHDDLYHDANSGELSRVMNDYLYLTASVPYIVTYPGDRYYEFDLSGKFYKETFSKDGAAQPQTICYFANDGASEYVEIPESATPVDYTYGGYTLKGTFLHVTKDPDLAKNALYNKEDNLYVLDSADETTGVEKHDGQEFSKAGDKDVVLPFRVYLTKAASPSGAPMRISGDSRGVTEPDDEEEPEQPVAPDDDVQPGIEVWAEGSALMVRTPYDVEMYVFNSIGQVVRYIKAYEGVNRYTGLPSALYIVNGTKVLIRR